MHRALLLHDILHCISDYLTKPELLCVRRVSKVWSHVARIHVWRTFRIDTNVPSDIVTSGPDAIEGSSVLRLLRAVQSAPEVATMIHHLQVHLDNHKPSDFEIGSWKHHGILIPTIQTAIKVIAALPALHTITIRMSLALENMGNAYAAFVRTFKELTRVIQSKNTPVHYILSERCNVPLHLNMLVWDNHDETAYVYPAYTHRQLLLHPNQFRTTRLELHHPLYSEGYDEVAGEHLEMVLHGVARLDELVLNGMPVSADALGLILCKHAALKRVVIHNCRVAFEYELLYRLLELKDLVELEISYGYGPASHGSVTLPTCIATNLQVLKIRAAGPFLNLFAPNDQSRSWGRLRVLDLESYIPTPAFDAVILSILKSCSATLQELYVKPYDASILSPTLARLPQLRALEVAAPFQHRFDVIKELCLSSRKLRGGLEFTVRSSDGWDSNEWRALFQRMNELASTCDSEAGIVHRRHRVRYGPADAKTITCQLDAELIRRVVNES
ncbi:hypothetical protein SeMB42_g02951 [Synchytrium endobioticum]|uniref:F-box domain-containing protein n=1 Tax=Synchytrium endobioticum TaxID=286115 RepID=A0A507CK12_9FUNG|nr:hypothetical protein SeLEV6574_g06787 [Synchytrium endobioticum]TPX48525.1 hypothetical protein SeMB42_g02951 [Synchytrium endobioticum]